MRTLTPVLLSALLLYGCDRLGPPSSEYTELMELPPERWVAFAENIPTEKRLDLYEEVYERSPHPPDIRLSEAFMDNPEASYIAIERRLRTRESLDRYYPILFQIEQNSHKTMCKDDRRSLVENTLMGGQQTHPYSGLFAKPCRPM